jgi:hypothetical protein
MIRCIRSASRNVGNRRKPSAFAVSRLEDEPAVSHIGAHFDPRRDVPTALAHASRRPRILPATLGKSRPHLPRHPLPSSFVHEFA